MYGCGCKYKTIGVFVYWGEKKKKKKGNPKSWIIFVLGYKPMKTKTTNEIKGKDKKFAFISNN